MHQNFVSSYSLLTLSLVQSFIKYLQKVSIYSTMNEMAKKSAVYNFYIHFIEIERL